MAKGESRGGDPLPLGRRAALGDVPPVPKSHPRAGGWAHPTPTVVGTPLTPYPPHPLRRTSLHTNAPSESALADPLTSAPRPTADYLAILSPWKPTHCPVRTTASSSSTSSARPSESSTGTGLEHERRIRSRVFLQSNPVPGEGPLRYGFEIPIDSPAAPSLPGWPPYPHAHPRAPEHAAPPAPPRAAASMLIDRKPPPSLEGPTPRPSPTPQAEGAGPALPTPRSAHPFRGPFSYLRLVPRSPSTAFVLYLRPKIQTRDWQTSAKLGRVSHGHSNEATPSCADFGAVQVPKLDRAAPGSGGPEETRSTIQSKSKPIVGTLR